MTLIANLLLFVLSSVVLIASGTLLVRNLTKISHFLKITEFAAAFIIMAVATSLPELFVGISSAIQKNTALTFGNVIGANLLDLTLLLGIFAILGKNLVAKSKRVKKDALFMFLIATFPLILFLIDGQLSRIDGIFLLAIFILYMRRLYRTSRGFEKEFELNGKPKRVEIIGTTIVFTLSILLLLASSHFLIKYATALSIDLMLPPIMIGLFLLSIGTTLPELTFGIRSVQLGHEEMTIGNQIGTVIANSTLILGITAIIYPITANFSLFFIAAVFMLFSAFIVAAFIGSGNRIDKKEGFALILLYILFIITEFYIKGIIIV